MGAGGEKREMKMPHGGALAPYSFVYRVQVVVAETSAMKGEEELRAFVDRSI